MNILARQSLKRLLASENERENGRERAGSSLALSTVSPSG